MIINLIFVLTVVQKWSERGDNMKFVIIGIISHFCCYMTGLIIGKLSAEEDIRRKRDEMGLTQEEDDDVY